MNKKTKDILRYFILAFSSIFLGYIVITTLCFSWQVVFNEAELSATVAGLIGSILVPIIGAWVFLLKWFFQTKVS